MYAPNKTLPPFWAASPKYNAGRDHLGIQNASVAAYAKLLPGLTNVTERLRYYGFYCWVLHNFRNTENLTNIIRRSELLLAFVMKGNPNLATVKAVSGSSYALKILQKNKGGDILLAKGADNGNENRYWQYSKGAFGQYFLGSLINLRLIQVRRQTKNSYVILENGLQLAEAFELNIPIDEKRLFNQIVEDGVCTIEHLKSLTSFALNKDLTETTEGDFYHKMLKKEDHDRDKQGATLMLRKQTLIALLNHLKSGNSWNTFLGNLYLNNGFLNSPQYSKATFGWYYYQLNEYVHFALESIFWSILYELDNGKLQIPIRFIKNLVKDVLEHEGINPEERVSGFQFVESDEYELVVAINEAIKSKDATAASWQGLNLFLLSYNKNKHLCKELENYAYLHDIWRKGAVVTLFEELIYPHLSSPLLDFFEKLLWRIITMHLSTAYEKMGNGEQNVLKLVIEDGFIAGRKVVTPGFTSPRLSSLKNYLIDLKMLFPESEQLTKNGETYLKDLNQ